MDVTDTATIYEEVERAARIANARSPVASPVELKRRKLAEARLIASQRGVDDPEVRELDLSCHNDCGEPLTVDSDDIFCCTECAKDWERRDRAARIQGRPST